MNKFRIIYTTIFLQIVVFSFAQNQTQKQKIYQYINSFSKSHTIQGVFPTVDNEETFFKTAKIFPIYKINFAKDKKISLEKNQDAFLVFYKDNLYQFFSNNQSMFFQNRPIVKNLKTMLNVNKAFKVGYLIKESSYYGDEAELILMSDELDYFGTENTNYSDLSNLIDNIYGSQDNFRESIKIENLRDNLASKQIEEGIKNNYILYEQNCPKDSSLVLNKFIAQIRLATITLTKNQEEKLKERINFRLYPEKFMYQSLSSKNQMSAKNDSILKKMINESKTLRLKRLSEDKNSLKYDFKLYNTNLTSDLLDILTNQQFTDYKNYIDTYYPVEFSLNKNFLNTKRMIYGKGKLISDGVISDTKNEKNLPTFNQYVTQLLSECGCKK